MSAKDEFEVALTQCCSGLETFGKQAVTKIFGRALSREALWSNQHEWSGSSKRGLASLWRWDFRPNRMTRLSTVMRSSLRVVSRSSRSTTTPRVLDKLEQKKSKRGDSPTRHWTNRFSLRSLILRAGDRMKSDEAHSPLQTHWAPMKPTPTT